MRVSSVSNGAVNIQYGYWTMVTSAVYSLGGTNIMTRSLVWDYPNMRLLNNAYAVNGTNIASYAYSCPTNSDLIASITPAKDG